MALLTNYLVKKSTRTNMIAGTHHSGFEVIQDTESKKWAIVLPSRYNYETINAIQQMIYDYSTKKYEFCVIEASPYNVRLYPRIMGDVLVEMDRIVDSDPILLHTYIENHPSGAISVGDDDTTAHMTQCYRADKDAFGRISLFNNLFVTFNLSCSPSKLNGHYRITTTFPSYTKVTVVECGIMGLRVINIYGQLRILYPDLVTSATGAYLTDKIIQKYLLQDDPNWNDYPSLVKASELGVSPIGLVQIYVREPVWLDKEKFNEIFSYTPDCHPM